MIQAGIKPVYVFDGKAPKLKREELDRRGVRREGAEDDLKKAQARPPLHCAASSFALARIRHACACIMAY